MPTHDTTSPEKIAGVTITISREHHDFEKDISECFDDKFITEANLMRFSDTPLHMQVMIGLATWIGSNVAWDIIKIGLKKFYEKFPKAHMVIRYKGVMYAIGVDGSVRPVVVDEVAYAHIRTTDDLIKHIESTSETKDENQSEWRETTLGEVVEIIGGGTPKTTVDSYWNGDIPWLSVVDFNSDNRWVSKTEKSITQEGLNNSSTKLLNPGDIILSARGTVGALAQLKTPMAFNQSCYGIKERVGISDKNYLYYLIKFQVKQISKNAHGAVFDTITRDTFDSIKILLPPLPEQRAIADILSSLDAKIELLREQNETLEKTAQTIFHEWIGRYSVESLEELPEGWRVGKIIEIIKREPVSYKCDKNDLDLKGTTPIIDQGTNGLYGYTSREPDFIASKENPVIVFTNHTCNYWFVDYPFCAIQNVLPYRGKNGYDEYFLYFMTKGSITFIEYKGHWPDFEAKDFIIPPVEKAGEFSKLAKPFLEKISDNNSQIQSLSKTRDTLLPKLMSGEVKITLK